MSAKPIKLSRAYVPPTTWYERNQREVAYAVLILGIALTMFALGSITTGCMLPNQNTVNLPSYIFYKIWEKLENCAGLYGIVGVIFGGLALVGGAKLLYGHHQNNKRAPKKVEVLTKEQVKGQEQGKRWKGVLLVLGFAIAMFGLGLMLSSLGVFKSRNLADMKSMIEEKIHGYDSEFWLRLKANWLNPMLTKLPLLITVGAITAIAGGGLMVVGGAGAHIREKWNSWFKREEDSLKDDNL